MLIDQCCLHVVEHDGKFHKSFRVRLGSSENHGPRSHSPHADVALQEGKEKNPSHVGGYSVTVHEGHERDAEESACVLQLLQNIRHDPST